MSDTLPPAVLVKAILAIRDAQPKPAPWYGPRWATDHIKSHDFRDDCAECHRAWRAMHR